MSTSVLHQILNRAGFSPRTKDKYTLVIDRWITFAGTDPAGWTRDKAQEFYDHLIDTGLKIQSANVYLASLRYVSRWYATKQANPQLDFAIVQTKRGRTRGKNDDESKILDENEATKLVLVGSVDDPHHLRDRAMVVLGLETGMRRMSLQGVTFEGFSTKHGYPSVRVPIKGEGGEETFDVPLSDTAWLALGDWMSWLRGNDIKTGPVFRRIGLIGKTYKAGDVMSLTNINEMIALRSELAGLRHVNPHMLRHTFIAWREQAGLSPFDIAAITGHKVRVVATSGGQVRVGAMQTYIHRDINAIRNSTPAWLKDLVERLVEQ
jgi:integrase